MQVIPAILSKSLEDITNTLDRVKGVTSLVQIDICDGIFGAEKTWMPNSKDVLPETFSYQFDVMVKDWRVPIAQCLLLKPISIIVHVDAFTDEDLEHLVKMIMPYDISLGISVSNDKDIHTHFEMVHKVRKMYKNIFIQVMGIKHIGQQGQPFDSKAPARIVFLKHEFKDLSIQVDGGVSKETIKLLSDAGASGVVAGSAIFGSQDVRTAYEELLALSV